LRFSTSIPKVRNIVADLRVLLSALGMMPPRPEGWVDPYPVSGEKVAALASQIKAQGKAIKRKAASYKYAASEAIWMARLIESKQDIIVAGGWAPPPVLSGVTHWCETLTDQEAANIGVSRPHVPKRPRRPAARSSTVTSGAYEQSMPSSSRSVVLADDDQSSFAESAPWENYQPYQDHAAVGRDPEIGDSYCSEHPYNRILDYDDSSPRRRVVYDDVGTSAVPTSESRQVRYLSREEELLAYSSGLPQPDHEFDPELSEMFETVRANMRSTGRETPRYHPG